MKNIYIILILIFSFTIISCAKKSDTSSTTTTTEVEGTWLTNCFQSGDYYHIHSATVSGTDVEVKYEWHTDSGCSTDYVMWEETYDSLSIGDEVTFSNGTKGHQFTLNIVNLKLTPQIASVVSTLNTDNSCGYSDWALNTAKDHTGKTCGSTAYPVANTSIQGLYNLVGNNLFISTLSTTGSYPTVVSYAITYVKQ